MRVLLDTHALLWWVAGDQRLSMPARELLESFESEVFVSAVSSWDVATKVRLGKRPGAGNLAQSFVSRIQQPGFQQLAITVEHGQRAGLLPGDQKDPFDRMLIAQSLAENMPIVSNERIFDRYLVRRIW